jgi:hypothetical protein
MQHASTLKKLQRILLLGEKQTILAALDGDAEKVMKISHICHTKL